MTETGHQQQHDNGPKRGPWPVVLGSALLAAVLGTFSHTEGDPGVAYLDSVGVVTACKGLTNAATKPVGHTIVLGTKYPPALCDSLMRRIVQRYSDQVRACVKVPVAAREVFAYLHFAWNIGTPAFCGSTLVRELNAGRYATACDQILRWQRAGGRDCRVRSNNCFGITIRRELEHAICTGRIGIPGLPDIPLGI